MRSKQGTIRRMHFLLAGGLLLLAPPQARTSENGGAHLLRRPVPDEKKIPVAKNESPPAGLPQILTLKVAEAYALAHHPDIARAEFLAKAADQGVIEARADLFPQLAGNVTFAKADNDSSRLATTSGGLTNPTILTRESNGLYLTQLITDFGKTALLTSRSRFSAKSAKEQVDAVRAAVLLNVDRSYFATLGAQALVSLTSQEVSTAGLLLDRIKALAASDLKSSLDVSLQAANLAQTRLMALNAHGRLQEAMADLCSALGTRDAVDFTLSEDPQEAPLPTSLPPLLAQALLQRPDILSLRAERDAALKNAAAKGAARLPVVQGIAAGGLTPYQEGGLDKTYGMVGVNVSVPLFTGGKLSAAQKEAQLRAKAAGQYLDAAETLLIRDVRTAWIEATTSRDRIQVSKQFLDASTTAFELAQSLYVAGTSSIVEVSQAELQQVQANIGYISARYEYQTRLAVLAYQIGQLK